MYRIRIKVRWCRDSILLKKFWKFIPLTYAHTCAYPRTPAHTCAHPPTPAHTAHIPADALNLINHMKLHVNTVIWKKGERWWYMIDRKRKEQESAEVISGLKNPWSDFRSLKLGFQKWLALLSTTYLYQKLKRKRKNISSYPFLKHNCKTPTHSHTNTDS